MKKKIAGNVSWVGYIDWELEKFHGDDYSIMNGSSQNAYLIEEEKTVLIDTVWAPHSFEFVQNLKNEIDLDQIDYIIVNHGEIDHSGALPALMDEIPETPIYCTENAVKSLEGQHGKRGWNFHVVKNWRLTGYRERQAACVCGNAHAPLARFNGDLYDGRQYTFLQRCLWPALRCGRNVQ